MRDRQHEGETHHPHAPLTNQNIPCIHPRNRNICCKGSARKGTDTRETALLIVQTRLELKDAWLTRVQFWKGLLSPRENSPSFGQSGISPGSVASLLYITTSRPCRTLFGYCPQPALGSRKADMKTLSFFFPTPFPCHVRAQAAIKPRHHGRQSCLCLAPISFMP